MNPSDTKLIADLEAAEALATRGPWEALDHTLHFGDCVLSEQIWSFGGVRIALTESQNKRQGGSADDAAFIAAARNALQRLLALVREQDEALRLAETVLSELGACPNPECPEPNCVRALGTVRRAIGKDEARP